VYKKADRGCTTKRKLSLKREVEVFRSLVKRARIIGRIGRFGNARLTCRIASFIQDEDRRSEWGYLNDE
jgi:hypothetical protein